MVFGQPVEEWQIRWCKNRGSPADWFAALLSKASYNHCYLSQRSQISITNKANVHHLTVYSLSQSLTVGGDWWTDWRKKSCGKRGCPPLTASSDSFLSHTPSEILFTVLELQAHNLWAIFWLCCILCLSVWMPEVLMQEDLLHCEAFSLLSPELLLSPTKTIQLAPAGAVAAQWSWLICLKALAAFLYVGIPFLIVYTTDTHKHAGGWTRAIFLFSVQCVVRWWVLDAWKPVQMTIAWGDILCSVLSTVCVCVLFIRYAVLWLEAMSLRVVTATEQTWVYSLALFIFFIFGHVLPPPPPFFF